MPSAAPSRLTLALSLAIVAVLAVTIGSRDRDGAVDIELARAAIADPTPDGDVLAASAAADGPAAAPATTVAPPPEAPPATPAPEPEPPPAAPSTTAAPAAPRQSTAPSPAPSAPPTTSAPAPAPAPQPTASTRRTGCESSMMQWMNEARAAHGVPALTTDGGIHWIALEWTDGMARRQDLAHNPDYAQRIFNARPQAVTAGENVGRGTGSERGLFDAFMNSPSHRNKILDAQYSHATVACTADASGQLWVTQNFWG